MLLNYHKGGARCGIKETIMQGATDRPGFSFIVQLSLY